MKKTPILSTVPFDENGVHHGFLRLPHSRDDSAWGSVMMPISVVRNGDGPTALLTGANHGDEYEGPVALQALAYQLRAEEINGRVIIVPAFNYPAFRAGRRTSPIDGGNMNRIFPGRPDGTVTEKIADYFQRTLIPMADLVVDIHAGGKTLDFVPFCAAHILPDKQQQAACVATMQAFDAPYSLMLLEIDSVGMYDTAAEEAGKVFISTELGGGGTSTSGSNRIAHKGIRNVLIHTGILQGELQQVGSQFLDMSADNSTLFSEHDGLVEFCVDLGETVASGDLIARVWSQERSGAAPINYAAQTDGILAGRHFPGLVKSGDFLALLAKEADVL